MTAWDSLREEHPRLTPIIDQFEEVNKQLAEADNAMAMALKAIYEGNIESATGILEKRAAVVITKYLDRLVEVQGDSETATD